MVDASFDSRAKQWDFHQDRVERARLIAEKITSLVPLSKEMHIMDFGCGTGLLGFNFVDKVASVTFADTSKGMLEQVHSKAHKNEIQNIHTLNLSEQEATSTFDLIVSLMTMHHIEDVQASIQSLVVLLKPQGILCISDLEAEDGSFHGEKKVPHNGFHSNLVLEYFRNCGLQNESACIGHVDTKVTDGNVREYPIFIAIGYR